ncbi:MULTISPECIES: YfiR family protein [Sulfurimonas]|uniref:YfiR family protein n=1 Tax=Sulfurimonas diazotrophicus TaxID=3131939 RepID=A0ABZ3H7D4_9BACT
MQIVRIAFFILLVLNAHAYESEAKLQSAIIGKIAEYITWPNDRRSSFTITILKNQMGTHFEDFYKNNTIKGKPVRIVLRDDVARAKNPEVLYVSGKNARQLPTILNTLKNQPVLTVSDMRGFAEKGGMVQIYFTGQRMRLKVNLDALEAHGLKASPHLLRFVDIVKEHN